MVLIATGDAACGGSDSAEYFRARISGYDDFEADPTLPDTMATCNDDGTWARIFGRNREVGMISVYLNICQPGSYNLIDQSDYSAIGVASCEFYPLYSTEHQYDALWTIPDSTCDVVVKRFDTHVAGTVNGVFIEPDPLTGIEADRVEVQGAFRIEIESN